MLTSECIHPELMRILSLCGHGDRILIADGNYPLASKTGHAEKVYLGLARGLPTVTQVLSTLQTCINIEAAAVMTPGADEEEPQAFTEFREMLPQIPVESLDRYAFYEACVDANVRLAIATGETRTFANILLTVGVA